MKKNSFYYFRSVDTKIRLFFIDENTVARFGKGCASSEGGVVSGNDLSGFIFHAGARTCVRRRYLVKGLFTEEYSIV